MWIKFMKKVKSIFYHIRKSSLNLRKTFRKFLQKQKVKISILFLCFTPILFFFSSNSLAKQYFKDSISKFEQEMNLIFLIAQVILIIYYCYQLTDIKQGSYTTRKRIELFVFISIHIVQLFANIYLLILLFNKDALSNITAQTSLQLCFDITYFSAMTFWGGDTIYSPQTRFIQSMVLLESFIFTIYISIILFNLFTPKTNKERNNT